MARDCANNKTQSRPRTQQEDKDKTQTSSRNTIQSVERFEFLIDAEIDGKPVTCLLDSGATETFVNYDWFQENFPLREYMSPAEDEVAVSACGTKRRVRGRLKSTIKFSTTSVQIVVTLVEDLEYELILGAEFIYEFVTDIKPKDLKLKIQDGNEVPIRKSVVKKIPIVSLVVSESVSIPPQSKSSVTCSISGSTGSSQLLCISDTGQCAERYGVVIP